MPTTPTTTVTPTTRKREGERRATLWHGKGRESNSRLCCCWCYDVIAIHVQFVHTRNDRQKDRTTNLLISSYVHYIHLGGDNNYVYSCVVFIYI